MRLIDTLAFCATDRARNKTLLGMWQRDLLVRGLSPTTLERSLSCLSVFLSHVDGIDLRRVQVNHVRSFLGALYERRLRSSTIQGYTNILRSFFRFLEREKLVAASPMAWIPNRKVEHRLPRFFSEKEMERLLNAASGLRDRALVEFLYATGCRVGELLQTRVSDVDLVERTALVQGKGQKQRIVLFGGKARDVLKLYLGSRRDGYLFEGNEGRPLTRQAVWKLLNKTAHRAGIGHCHPHSIRHSFATHLLRRGMGLRELQELLGHASINSTAIYTHLDISDLARTIQRFHPRAWEVPCEPAS